MPPIPRITPAEADLARDAAQRVVDTHRYLVDFLRIGQTLPQIDAFVAQTHQKLGCKSCFLGYRVGRSPAFPSHACLSVNHCVVHGTAASHEPPLKPGDVLKIDIGVTYRGWVGDAGWTYVFGEKSPRVKALTDCGKQAIRKGVAALKPGAALLDWAKAVGAHVEGECKFHCIKRWGGHGYGRKMHAPPHILNAVPDSFDEWPDAFIKLMPGNLLAVEPMIAVGTGETVQRGNQWPVYTADGSLAVHYEHDVLITSDGPEVLTAALDELPDVVTR